MNGKHGGQNNNNKINWCIHKYKQKINRIDGKIQRNQSQEENLPPPGGYSHFKTYGDVPQFWVVFERNP